MSTPDPITCPECGGTLVEWVAGLPLACQFCHGKGHDGRPGWTPQNPPPLPAAWEHKIWRDPFVAAAIGCRYCLGSGKVVNLGSGAVLATSDCPACSRPGPAEGPQGG